MGQEMRCRGEVCLLELGFFGFIQDLVGFYPPSVKITNHQSPITNHDFGISRHHKKFKAKASAARVFSARRGAIFH
jgi:hypothetical protein